MKSFPYLLPVVLLSVVTVSAVTTRLLAICDIGSNGIRFGVLGSRERDLPHIFEERAPISLYEAQHISEQDEDAEDRHEASASPLTLNKLRPIAKDVLEDVEVSMRRFADIAKRHNADLWIVATEASRTAPNSEELCKRIREATGKQVKLLKKEEESRLSALGISATLYNPSGPSMDLGGGSLEINYLTNGQPASLSGSGFSPQSIKFGSRVVGKLMQEEDETTPRGQDASVSDSDCFPGLNYISRLFRKLLGKEDRTTARDQVFKGIKDAKTAMTGKGKKRDGQTLYLTGGGFRSIGEIAMSYDPNYPFSTINGFTIRAEELRTICTKFANMHPDIRETELSKVSSIRKDRHAQMPANLLIMLAAIEAFNPVDITFAEGGVRHGLALDLMLEEERQRDPLAVSADRFTTKMGCAVSVEEQKRLAAYLRENDDVKKGSHAIISPRLVDAAIRLVHLADDQTDNLFQLIKHAPLLGVKHQERAVLLLILIHRYGEVFKISSDGNREGLPLTVIENLAGGEKIVQECKRIGERMKKMIPQPVNVLGPVARLGINARPPIEVSTYATKLGSSVQDKEMEALNKWCATYLPVDKDKDMIPSHVVEAAIQLVHLADAFGSDSQAAVAFELIMRAQFVRETKWTEEDHAKLALILLYRYKGDHNSDAKGWDIKALFKKNPNVTRKACQRLGKMLSLAMEVNPTGDLEAGNIELTSTKGPTKLQVVVKNRNACGVDVPHFRKMLEKMKKKGIDIKLDVSKAENDPISSSTIEAISSDAQSTKVPISSSTDEASALSAKGPISSSTDEAIALSAKGPISSSADEPIVQSPKDPRSRSTDEEILPDAQSLENPSFSTNEPTSSDAQSTKVPFSSSTDEAIALSAKGPISSSTDEAIALSAKGPISSSTDEAMAQSAKGPISSSADEPIVQSPKDPRSSSTDEEILPDAQSLENPSFSTNEPTSSDAQSTKVPISSSTDEAIALSAKGPISSSADEPIAQSPKGPRSHSTDEEILPDAQSLENPSSSTTAQSPREPAQSPKNPRPSSADDKILPDAQSLENPSSSSTNEATLSDAQSPREPAREELAV